jgi:signal transduction histidine kinase
MYTDMVRSPEQNGETTLANLFKEKGATIAVLMTAAIFMVDIFTPLWYEAWVFYLIPLFFVFRSPMKRPYLYSVIITVLVFVGWILPHPDGTPLMRSAVNRLTGILGGWGVSLLLMRLKGLERQKEDFYALVTHDIKSSLTTILAYTELLLTDERLKLDKETREAISAVERSGHKILNLVNDFLDLSRLESGRITLNKSSVDLRELLSEVHEGFKQRAREKQLELCLKLPKDRVVCMLDKRYVELAVGNLVENAINYTHSGGVTLNVEPQTGSGGDFVVISVSDTGPGDTERVYWEDIQQILPLAQDLGRQGHRPGARPGKRGGRHPRREGGSKL